MSTSLRRSAEIIFAIPLLVFGIIHFASADMLAGYIATWPAATLLVYVAGIGLFLAGLAIVLNKYVALAMKLLVIELAIFIVALHIPGVAEGGETMGMALGSLLKDLGLLAGALMVLAAHQGDKN